MKRIAYLGLFLLAACSSAAPADGANAQAATSAGTASGCCSSEAKGAGGCAGGSGGGGGGACSELVAPSPTGAGGECCSGKTKVD
ncbi:MAG: hypothetical protein AB7O97_12735 [Planctomycetota bacterium]